MGLFDDVSGGPAPDLPPEDVLVSPSAGVRVAPVPPLATVPRGLFSDVGGDVPTPPQRPDPNAVDWSKFNQPLGELKPSDPSWTEYTKSKGQDALMAAGMPPYTARHWSEGLVGIGGLTPMGSVLSAADAAYNAQRGNYGSAVIDAIGAAPGALAIKRFTRGMPRIDTAEIPKFNPATGRDELQDIARSQYRAVDASPVVYHPSMMDDLVNAIRTSLTQRGFNPVKAPSVFSALDAAVNRPAPPPGAINIITPNDFDTLRQQLRGGAPGTQDSSAGRLAIDRLDRAMANPLPQHVLRGSRADLDTVGRNLADARGNYRAYTNADVVEGKIDTAAIKADIAHSGGNLDNTTRQYLGGLLTTKAGQRAIAGTTDAEKAAIEQAARGDWLTNALRYGGKFLGGGGGLGQYVASFGGGSAASGAAHMLGADPIMTGAIGGMGTAATMGTGIALRNAADARTVRAAEGVGDFIRKNSPEYARRSALSPPIIDPFTAQRDAIAYAMTPQLRQGAQNIWDTLHIPYDNREQE
jgi:hypothetical protein